MTLGKIACFRVSINFSRQTGRHRVNLGKSAISSSGLQDTWDGQIKDRAYDIILLSSSNRSPARPLCKQSSQERTKEEG